MYEDKIMQLIFIRHGKTEGNLRKAYIGVTDEPLCEKGIAELDRTYPKADIVITSGMLRCRMTADIIYKNVPHYELSGLNECNFGKFEGKNHSDLDGNEYYQKWIDSMGELPFPDGESMAEFKKRSVSEFRKIMFCLENENVNTAAFVIHGGTIMSILSELGDEGKSYYDYITDNGEGFVCEWEDGKCRNIMRL